MVRYLDEEKMNLAGLLNFNDASFFLCYIILSYEHLSKLSAYVET